MELSDCSPGLIRESNIQFEGEGIATESPEVKGRRLPNPGGENSRSLLSFLGREPRPRTPCNNVPNLFWGNTILFCNIHAPL